MVDVSNECLIRFGKYQGPSDYYHYYYFFLWGRKGGGGGWGRGRAGGRRGRVLKSPNWIFFFFKYVALLLLVSVLRNILLSKMFPLKNFQTGSFHESCLKVHLISNSLLRQFEL